MERERANQIKVNTSFSRYSLAVGEVACTCTFGLLCAFKNLKGISEDRNGSNVVFHTCRIELKLAKTTDFKGAMPRGYCCLSEDRYTFLENCPPFPPLSQQFALSEK